MLKKLSLAAAAAGLFLAPLATAVPADAAINVKAGVLTCHVDGGWGFVFGSSRALQCVFSGGGRNEHYVGTISKFGIDIGYLESGVIVWGVFAPATNVAPGSLGGEYGGATAGAALGVGANANVLIGGSNQSLSLQPVSFEGDKGLNVALGIAAISLKFQP